MQSNFLLEIVTPDKMIFSGIVNSVEIPGVNGGMTILPNHAPLINNIIPGKITIKTVDSSDIYVAYSGFAQIENESVILLLDEVIHLDDLNRTDLNSRIEEAKTALYNATEHIKRNEHEDILHQLSSLKHSLDYQW